MAQKGLVAGIKQTKKILALKEEFSFSETFENQSALADAYLEAEMYDQAIENYEVCLSGTFQNDFYIVLLL